MNKTIESKIRRSQYRRNGTLSTRLFPGKGGASNPGQVQVGMWLQGPPTKLTTQASTGLISTYIAPSLSSLTNSSFALCFDEWRLTKIKFSLFPLGANGGTTKFVMDDEDLTLPVLAYANSRRGFLYVNDNANFKSTPKITYRSENVADLQWNSCRTQATLTPMALKVYTDLSTYVSQPSTDLWLVSWEGYFEFRGIGNQN